MTGPSDAAAAPPEHEPTARRLHWANALLVLVTVALAYCIVDAPRHGDARGWLVALHASCGLTILVLVLAWSARRLRRGSPPLRPPLTRLEAAAARTVQFGLLLVLVAMPVSGYVSLAAAGRPLSLFGLVTVPPLLPESGALSQVAIAVHLVGQFLLYGLVALHVGAALLHGFVRRDGILERMLPRRP